MRDTVTIGLLGCLGRPVALVRDADDVVTEPEREEHLGGRRDERADPHTLRLPAAAG